MTVPDPAADGAPRTIELDPSKPVQLQAQARYERARRLDDGRAITVQRLAAVERELAALAPVAAQLAGADALDPAGLDALRRTLHELGALPTPKPPVTAKPKPAANRNRVAAENLRRFTSIEGYEILVGRDNQMNDRLTLRIANGNDLWLHVGSGRPGSHVVVRLPKGKTASLDTLIDAGHLAGRR